MSETASLCWVKKCVRLTLTTQVGHAFRWECSCKGLELAPLLGQLGVFLTWCAPISRRRMRLGLSRERRLGFFSMLQQLSDTPSADFGASIWTFGGREQQSYFLAGRSFSLGSIHTKHSGLLEKDFTAHGCRD